MVGFVRAALARRLYYGWVIVAACFLASVAVFGSSYAFGVFYPVFVEAFGVSPSRVALVFGLQVGLLYVTGAWVGRLVDRYGRRRVLAGSSALAVAGLAWTAAARTYLELLVAFGVVAAVGMAGLYVVSYATLPAWFDRRRGTATGLAAAGLGVGLVVVPPGADAAITAAGWRVAMLAVAGAVALLCLAVTLLFVDDPAAVGTTSRVAGTEWADDGDRAGSPRAIVTSPPFLLTFVGWVLIFAPLYAVLSNVVVHAEATGVGRSVGVLAIAVVGLTTTVARVGIGAISDRMGRITVFVASGALLGLSTVGLGLARSPTVFLAVVVAFGAGYGGSGGLIGAVTADLFGNRSLDTVFGALSVSFAVAGLGAPPLAGLWFETSGSFRLAFAVAGLAGVVGAGFTVLGARLCRDADA